MEKVEIFYEFMINQVVYFSSLLGNRISGTIPKEMGNIATLEEL